MKKAFALLLSLTLAFGCLLVGSIPAAAAGEGIPENLAANYSIASGNVAINGEADIWGSDNVDGTQTGIFGGYLWKLGCSNTGSESAVGRATITTNALEANTTYWFCYNYTKVFKVVFESVTDPNGAVVKQGYAANTGTVQYDNDIFDNEVIVDGWDTRFYRTAFTFTTGEAGVYTINLKCSKAWAFPDCDWSATGLSDLRLVKQEPGNLATAITLGENLVLNGVKTTSSNLGGTAAWSLFGGQSWALEAGGSLSTITYKANLEKGKVYRFSYVYANDYKIQLNTEAPVSAPDGTAVAGVAYDSQLTPVAVPGNRNAYRVEVQVLAPVSGEYSFNLETQNAWQNISCKWTRVTLSDIELYEVTQESPFAELSTENAAAGLVGASMRAGAGNVKQAMRVKNSVSKAVVENGINGYTVTEYGSLVAGTEKLGSNELTLELIGSDIPAVKGVAYNKTTQPTPVVWAESEQYLTFTAALTGITVEKSNRELTVRPYMVLQKDENSMVLYGEAQSASVFEICKAILSTGSEADKAAVTAIMAGNAEFKNAYDAWSGNN